MGMSYLQYIGYFLIAIFAMILLAKFFLWPLKILLKLIINGALGVIILLIVNLVGANFNFFIGINAVTALIAGFFGIPGVIFLILFKVLF
jgi:inhibitor of the pro-sigma K processing machinery